MPLLLTNIGQLLTLRGPAPRRGRDLSELSIVEDAAVLCAEGKIAAAGPRLEVTTQAGQNSQEIDCAGGVVLPGFVDSHTHPVFAAPRLVDFEKRIAGATYEDIAAAGGGIHSSVDAVRSASREQLASAVLAALDEMSRHGTTTVETKSGYGLSVEAEIKSLKAIADAAQSWPGTVVPTLLGAHVVPKEYADRRDEYVRIVCDEMIPCVETGLAPSHQITKNSKDAGQARPLRRNSRLADFVDVFVERGAFTADEAERIFAAAQQHGLGIRAHVCQLSATRERWVVEMAQRFEIASFDHLDCVCDADIAALANLNTICTLLPGANYFLGLSDYPSARKLIDAGVPVALATDYNPGTSPTLSMPMVLSLACTQMKMSPAEAIAASTINGACALRLQHQKGSIEMGKDADLAIFGVRDYRELTYWFGVNRCRGVVMNGKYSPIGTSEDESIGSAG